MEEKKKWVPLSVYNRKKNKIKDSDLILEAYNFKGYDKCRRYLHETSSYGIIMNHKKISRLMDKFNPVLSNKKS